jgi:hypothetical protein
LQVGNNQGDSQEDYGRGWKHSRVQSDNSRFARRADSYNKMATKCYTSAGRKDPELMRKVEWDKELVEMRARMDELAFDMQQNAKSIWVYEWPMRKPKAKWPVKELMARRQCRLFRGWLRHAENLDGPEEMVQVCEPETGRNLGSEDELGSAEDLKDCQEDSQEIPNCQEGKELRSLWDLTDCHEDSWEISHFQEGNDMRSLRDLMDCQEGSRKIPIYQEGMGTKMRLSESLMESKML